MIENTALRALIAGAVAVVLWWVLARVLLALGWTTTPFVVATVLLIAAAAVWVFLGLRRPARAPTGP